MRPVSLQSVVNEMDVLGDSGCLVSLSQRGPEAVYSMSLFAQRPIVVNPEKADTRMSMNA